MQALALEIGYSETTFVLPAEKGGTAQIRIFTPFVELPFAGHPILGTAWVLGQPLERSVIELETGMGVVPVEMDRDESGALAFGRMTQPVPRFEPYPETGELLSALGVTGSALPVERYDNGVPHTFVALESTRRGRGRAARLRRARRAWRQGQLLRRLGGLVEDAHVRAVGRRKRGSRHWLGGRTAGLPPLSARARRVGRVDRDLAGRRDRASFDALCASRRCGRRDHTRAVRRPGGHRRARRVPPLGRREELGDRRGGDARRLDRLGSGGALHDVRDGISVTGARRIDLAFRPAPPVRVPQVRVSRPRHPASRA